MVAESSVGLTVTEFCLHSEMHCRHSTFICISIRKIILWSHLPFFAKCKERQVRSEY